MSSTRSKGEANFTNFTDDLEKIGKNKNRRKSKNMADIGNKDPQHQEQGDEHQEPQDDETGTQQPPLRCTYWIWTTLPSARHDEWT